MSRFFWPRSRALLFSRASTVLCLALALASASVMCAPPRNEQAVEATQASATSVRRTAVANVQRMLSGDQAPPTPTAPPTPAPRPTCPDAIWWYEAHTHVGES